MTNYEKLKTMNEEEIAKFLSKFTACIECEYYNKENNDCVAPRDFLCTKTYVEALIGIWLDREFEE